MFIVFTVNILLGDKTYDFILTLIIQQQGWPNLRTGKVKAKWCDDGLNR